MRTIINILLLVIAAMSVWVSISIAAQKKLEIENDRLSTNITEYGRAVSTLTMTAGELRQEVEKGNEKIVKADSILKVNGETIKTLRRMVATKVTVADADTILLTDTIIQYIKDEGKYKVSFREDKGCISIAGFLMSTDPKPEISITEREVTVEVHQIDVARRWWQFWKPRTRQIVTSNCGEVEILEINKI